MSQLGQGPLWPAGEWHSRSTPSSGNTRAFGHLRFVPKADQSEEVSIYSGEMDPACADYADPSLSSSALASFRSSVSKPSVNHP